MKAKLMIGDKQIDVEIDEQQLHPLKGKKHTGYERMSYYYFTANYGTTFEAASGNALADNCYQVANYYSSKQVAFANDRADTLMRQLRRFSVEHRKESIDWYCCYQNKYYIQYDYVNKELTWCAFPLTRFCGTVWFDSAETAKQAIEAFHDELIWYFTEYKDCL